MQSAFDDLFGHSSDTSDSESDSESSVSSISEPDREVDTAREYAIGVFLSHINNNTTQAAVERELENVHRTLAADLPGHVSENIPKTRKQLVAMFRRDMYRIVRIPVCKQDCQLLQDEDGLVCPTCSTASSRLTGAGNLKPCREFCVVVLAEVIREWFADPKVAKLLRYPHRRVPTAGQQCDVYDGVLWAEFETHFGQETDLAWVFVCDPVETNKRKKHSVTPRMY
jgi:hypothetical protein